MTSLDPIDAAPRACFRVGRRRALARILLLVAVITPGCEVQPTAPPHATATITPGGSGSNRDPRPKTTPEHPDHGDHGNLGTRCENALPLGVGDVLSGEQTPSEGDASSVCRASDAPQRFYTFVLPPALHATITVRTRSEFHAVVRVLGSCDATACIADGEASPGAPLTLQIEGSRSEPVARIVTVSSIGAGVQGSYDLALDFAPAAPGLPSAAR